MMHSRKKTGITAAPAVATMLAFLVLSSCAVPTGQFVSRDKNHPASPDAVEGTIEDPGRFLAGGATLPAGAAEKSTESGPASLAQYVCPMHPDVGSNTPGNCTRCGMALKERKAETKEEHHHEH